MKFVQIVVHLTLIDRWAVSAEHPSWLQWDYYFISSLLGRAGSLWHLNGASGWGGSSQMESWTQSHGAVSNAGPWCHVTMNGAIVCLCVPRTESHCLELTRGLDESGNPPGPLPGWLLPSHRVKSQCAGSRLDWELNTWWMQRWGKRNTRGDLSWVERDGIFSATPQ